MALPKREFERLRRNVAAFLNTASKVDIQVEVLGKPYPLSYSRNELHELWIDVGNLLDNTPDAEREICFTNSEGEEIRTTVRWGLSPTTLSTGSDGQVLLIDVVGPERGVRIGASARAGFLLTLAFLLKGPAGAALRRCPECRRVFVRTGRQIYCRTTCAKKANYKNRTDEQTRRYRKKQYDKEGWEVGARSKKSTDDNKGGK